MFKATGAFSRGLEGETGAQAFFAAGSEAGDRYILRRRR
jgi:hypothetical protein